MQRKITQQNFRFEDIMRQANCQNNQVLSKADINSLNTSIAANLTFQDVQSIINEFDPISQAGVPV
jgi:hypothetical protein